MLYRVSKFYMNHSAFRDSYDVLNYYLSKESPTPDLHNAIRDFSFKYVIERKDRFATDK